MQDQNQSGLLAFIESVGGADMFIWLVTFSVLIVVAVGLYFFMPHEEG